MLLPPHLSPRHSGSSVHGVDNALLLPASSPRGDVDIPPFLPLSSISSYRLLLHLQLSPDSPSSSSSSPKVSASSPSVSSFTKGMPLVGTEPWTFWTKAFDGVSPPSLPLFPLSNFYCVILEVLFSLGEVTSCILNSFV